jgi:hypothetical protein
MAEVQNIHIPEDGVEPLFPDGDFALTVKGDDWEIDGAFITIDPAGAQKKSNATCIAAHIVYGNDKIELVELIAEVLDPMNTIDRALTMAEKYNAFAIFPEGVAYQATLAFWFNQILGQLNLSHIYAVQPLNVGTRSKLSRIRAWTRNLLVGNSVICNIDVKSAVLWQAIQYDVTKTNNIDDILDSGAHGELVRNNPRYLDLVLQQYASGMALNNRRRPKLQASTNMIKLLSQGKPVNRASL